MRGLEKQHQVNNKDDEAEVFKSKERKTLEKHNKRFQIY